LWPLPTIRLARHCDVALRKNPTKSFHPGDTLALYTDGITESFNEARDEYGEDRLIESLCRHRCQPSQSLLENIVADVRQFSPTNNTTTSP
jgi:serine phosphatase RsbU (regulator of sigma subunit)